MLQFLNLLLVFRRPEPKFALSFVNIFHKKTLHLVTVGAIFELPVVFVDMIHKLVSGWSFLCFNGLTHVVDTAI